MAPFPVQGITEGDFVVVLALVDTDDTMSTVAEKIAYHAVGKRVEPTDGPMRVRRNGQILPDEVTLTEAGILPLDVLEVVTT